MSELVIRWDLDFSPVLGRKVKLETLDGNIRDTKISAVKFHELQIAGFMCPVPVRLVLDDESDWIDVRNISKVSVL